jgi:cell division protein FtsL
MKENTLNAAREIKETALRVKPQAKKQRLRRISQTSNPKKQKGELSMIESAGVLAVAAVIALGVVQGIPYIMNLARAYRLQSEVKLFNTGVLNATTNDASFANETLETLAENRAFDAAGSRVASDHSSVTGLFGGTITAVPGTVTNADDSEVIGYTAPSTVCAMAASSIASAFAQVAVNGTTIVAPGTTYDSGVAGTACNSAGGTATIEMYVTR